MQTLIRPFNGAKRCAQVFDVSVATWWRWAKDDPKLKGHKVGGRTLWTQEQLTQRIEEILSGEAESDEQ